MAYQDLPSQLSKNPHKDFDTLVTVLDSSASFFEEVELETFRILLNEPTKQAARREIQRFAKSWGRKIAIEDNDNDDEDEEEQQQQQQEEDEEDDDEEEEEDKEEDDKEEDDKEEDDKEEDDKEEEDEEAYDADGHLRHLLRCLPSLRRALLEFILFLIIIVLVIIIIILLIRELEE